MIQPLNMYMCTFLLCEQLNPTVYLAVAMEDESKIQLPVIIVINLQNICMYQSNWPSRWHYTHLTNELLQHPVGVSKVISLHLTFLQCSIQT